MCIDSSEGDAVLLYTVEKESLGINFTIRHFSILIQKTTVAFEEINPTEENKNSRAGVSSLGSIQRHQDAFRPFFVSVYSAAYNISVLKVCDELKLFLKPLCLWMFALM